MFNSHLVAGQQKVRGRDVEFDLTQSGLQVANVPLECLTRIKKHLRQAGVTRILDFGAGRLRNTIELAKSRSLEVWFSEFAVVVSHELTRRDLKNKVAFAERFKARKDPPTAYLWNQLQPRTQALVSVLPPKGEPSKILEGLLLDDLNRVLWKDVSLYSGGAFASLGLSPEVASLAGRRPSPGSTRLLRLNRFLIEAAYPRFVTESRRNHLYPHEVEDEPEEFDAIVLSYVLHTLPHQSDRHAVLEACREKLAKGGWLVIASPKYNTPIRRSVSDDDRYDIGWVRAFTRKYQTFYSEPLPALLTAWVRPFGFQGPADEKPLTWKQSTAHVLGFVRA